MAETSAPAADVLVGMLQSTVDLFGDHIPAQAGPAFITDLASRGYRLVPIEEPGPRTSYLESEWAQQAPRLEALGINTKTQFPEQAVNAVIALAEALVNVEIDFDYVPSWDQPGATAPLPRQAAMEIGNVLQLDSIQWFLAKRLIVSVIAKETERTEYWEAQRNHLAGRVNALEKTQAPVILPVSPNPEWGQLLALREASAGGRWFTEDSGRVSAEVGTAMDELSCVMADVAGGMRIIFCDYAPNSPVRVTRANAAFTALAFNKFPALIKENEYLRALLAQHPAAQLQTEWVIQFQINDPSYTYAGEWISRPGSLSSYEAGVANLGVLRTKHADSADGYRLVKRTRLERVDEEIIVAGDAPTPELSE